MDNDNIFDKLTHALNAARQPKKTTAIELRRMARGATPYFGFEEFSPWIKNVWLAAAELLDPQESDPQESDPKDAKE